MNANVQILKSYIYGVNYLSYTSGNQLFYIEQGMLHKSHMQTSPFAL